MRLSPFLLVVLTFISVNAKSLGRNKAYEDFKKICPKGESVNGLTIFLHKSKKGDDLRLMVVCKAIDPNKKFKVGKCRDADEFQLFDGKRKFGENTIGSSSNCAQGEYLAGIKSSYDKNDGRTFQYHCCMAKNAKIDEEMGCHHVDPGNPFSSKQRGRLLLKNEVVPTGNCPRDALSGFEISSKGLALKFCPYKVDGVNYDSKCYEIKEKIHTYTECDGIEKESEFKKCVTGDEESEQEEESEEESKTKEEESEEESKPEEEDKDEEDYKDSYEDYDEDSGNQDDSEIDLNELGDLGDGSCSKPKVFKNKALVGFAQQVADVFTVEECIQQCSNAEDDFGLECMSGMYYPTDLDQNCVINSESGADHPNLLVDEAAAADFDGIYSYYFEC